jgi:galactokinase
VRDVPELVRGQTDALHGDLLGAVAQSLEDFIAEDDGAATDADEDHVKAQADAGPQVDLEQSLAEPNALRAPQPLLPEGHPNYHMRERLITHPTFRSPGRVNLIGEHTDYNDGIVMPAAIEFATYVEVSERADRRLVVHSENYPETIEFDLDDPDPHARGHWSDYVRGVAVMLGLAGHRVGGANLRIRSDVPMGAGLSSSAALEVAAALALLRDEALDRTELAKLCQRAENEFVGVRCGIMDQFIACHARAGQALMLDCRSLEYRYAALPLGVKLVIANTMVRHSLASGEYNRRRAECEEGAAYFERSLRDVTVDDLAREGRGLSEVVCRRCRHVITENGRVMAASAALERGDLKTFGKLMEQSHRSLRDDYEVSCAELDAMVEIAASEPGVYGSRMTGGGFGGCTISLVEEEYVEAFRETILRRYREAVGRDAAVYVSGAAGGAGEISIRGTIAAARPRPPA